MTTIETTVHGDINPELTRDRHAVKVVLAATLRHYDRVLLQGQMPDTTFEGLDNETQRFYLTLAEDTLARLGAAAAARDAQKEDA